MLHPVPHIFVRLAALPITSWWLAATVRFTVAALFILAVLCANAFADGGFVNDLTTAGILWQVLVWAIGIIQVLLTAWGVYITRSLFALQREHMQFQLYVAQNYATKDEFLLSVTEINRKMDKLLSDFNALLLTR